MKHLSNLGEDIMKLGSKIHEIRVKEGLTIRELAEITGLSIGFISNLERDQTSPTISNLQLICKALKINLLDLMREVSEEQKVVVTRKEERKELYSNKTGVKYETLNKFDKANALSIIMDKKTDFGESEWKHDSDEIGIIIEGEFELVVDDVVYHLKEGDTVFISKYAGHNYRNPIDEKSVSYWIFI